MFEAVPVLRVHVSEPADWAFLDVSLLPADTVEAIFDIENGRTFAASSMSEIYEAALRLSEEDVKV